MDLLNLNDIRLFLKVAELNGFSAAAVHFNIHKSRVSRRIAALEESVGMRLLEREHNEIKLTESGHKLIEHYQSLFQQLAIAETRIREDKSTLQGKLQISLPLNLAKMFADIFCDFCLAYPLIELDCELVGQSDDFGDKNYDVAFLVNRNELPDGEYIARKLADVPSGLYATPEFINLHGPISQIEQLSELPCLCTSHSNNYFFSDGKKSISVAVSGPLKIDSSAALLQSALRGLGIIRLPSFAAAPYLKNESLAALQLNVPSHPYQIYMAYKERSLLPAKVRAFIDFFLEIETFRWAEGQ